MTSVGEKREKESQVIKELLKMKVRLWFCVCWVLQISGGWGQTDITPTDGTTTSGYTPVTKTTSEKLPVMQSSRVRVSSWKSSTMHVT